MNHAEIEERILRIGSLAGGLQWSEEPDVRELATLALALSSNTSWLCGWREGALKYLGHEEDAAH